MENNENSRMIFISSCHGETRKPLSAYKQEPMATVFELESSSSAAENNESNSGKKPIIEAEQLMDASAWPPLGLPASSSDIHVQRIGVVISQNGADHIVDNNVSPKHIPVPQRSMRSNESNSSSNGGMRHHPLSAPPYSSPSIPLNNYGSSWRDLEWGNHQNFNIKIPHMQPQRCGPMFIRHSYTPPPNPYLFMPYAPYRPYPEPMTYHEQYYGPSNYQHMRRPEAIYTNDMVDPQLPQKIRCQIEYYFSKDNLVKDVYLRQRMDDQGWVSIHLIAGFRKIRELTNNINVIVNALQSSNSVEIQGDKIRKKDDWRRWIIVT